MLRPVPDSPARNRPVRHQPRRPGNGPANHEVAEFRQGWPVAQPHHDEVAPRDPRGAARWALNERSARGQGQCGPAWRSISRLISLSEIGLFRKTRKASAATNPTRAMAG